MHTCLDQYIANKANKANGGLKWIEAGGGYYAEWNRRLKGQGLWIARPLPGHLKFSK
jgi:hypothetical protein